jgi:SAM-dependent methyltransferase
MNGLKRAIPPVSEDSPEDLIALMSSLADSTRLRLLCLLDREQLGVAELCQVLQLPQSTVSRHLKLLMQRGWLSSRARGAANLYRMYTSELSPHAQDLWRVARSRTESWATLAHDQLRLTQLITRRRKTSFFAQAVHQWERLRTELYGSAFLQRAVASFLPRHWSVVDLGCGVGEMVDCLARCVERVVGIDQSEHMLARAHARTTRQANVTLMQGELTAVPLASCRFDAAVTLLVLSYLPEPRAALREAARLLRVGGRLVLVTLLRHDREDFRREMGQVWPGFGTQELCEMLRSAGIEPEGCVPMATESGARGPALLLAAGTKTDTIKRKRG